MDDDHTDRPVAIFLAQIVRSNSSYCGLLNRPSSRTSEYRATGVFEPLLSSDRTRAPECQSPGRIGIGEIEDQDRAGQRLCGSGLRECGNHCQHEGPQPTHTHGVPAPLHRHSRLFSLAGPVRSMLKLRSISRSCAYFLRHSASRSPTLLVAKETVADAGAVHRCAGGGDASFT